MSIARRIAVAIAAAAAGATALLLSAAFVPTLFGYEALIVTSGSMGRAMPTGAVALTRLVDARSVAAGDIVSFRYPGATMPTTHRIDDVVTKEGRRMFRTKGDANADPDPELVPGDGPIQQVERVVPYAGKLVRAARSPAGGVVLFAVPIAGLVVDRRRRGRAPERRRARRRAPDLTVAGWSVSTMMLSASVAEATPAVSRPQRAPDWLAAFVGEPQCRPLAETRVQTGGHARPFQTLVAFRRGASPHEVRT